MGAKQIYHTVRIMSTDLAQNTKKYVRSGKMNPEYERLFGKNIRRAREAKQLTQEQVAAKLQIGGCDITRSALAKIEVGQRHVYPDEIRLLKTILSVTYDELFDF